MSNLDHYVRRTRSAIGNPADVNSLAQAMREAVKALEEADREIRSLRSDLNSVTSRLNG